MGAFVAKTPEQSEAEEQRLPAKPGHSEHPSISSPSKRVGLGARERLGSVHRAAGDHPRCDGCERARQEGRAIEDGPAILAAQKLRWVILHETKDYLRYGLTVNGRRCYFTKWDTPTSSTGA